MDSKVDIGQLQQLNDAIAVTLDAIRRLATSAPNGAGRTEVGWIPAPGATAFAERGARLEHSAWPAWEAPTNGTAPWTWPRGFAHSAWPTPAQPAWAAVPWPTPSWPTPSWPDAAWRETPWTTAPWVPSGFWGHFRPF